MITKTDKAFIAVGAVCCSIAATLTSCQNGDIEFDDYDYQTVYFAQQTPVRTITLGDDVYDRTLDNEHRFQIYATLGGVWKNRQDRSVQVAVDESLCQGLQFDDGRDVLPMPSAYYTLSGNSLVIPAGEIMGCVDVRLADAFFSDPRSIDVTYVIPMRIVGTNDSILDGKDYTLYAVNYKNMWDGCWISHGTDQIDLNGVKSTEHRQAEYLEQNELRYLKTAGYSSCTYDVPTSVEANGSIERLTCRLVLTFDDGGHCIVTTTTPGCTASGSGQWTRQGAKKAWGDKDRDELALDYIITWNYTDGGAARYKTVSSTDTLVMRDRQSKFETFTLKN